MMKSVANVTGTAFVVAEFRAEENAEPEPLYRDAVVPLFLNDVTRQAADRIANIFPPVRKMVRLRTRYLDDCLDQQLLGGCQQVVILGAGLDTRAVRKQAPGVTYYEIDDPATIAMKQTMLADHGMQGPSVFIPGNYVTTRLIDLLRENAIDFTRQIHFIWEGNTMYLAKEDVVRVMSDIVNHVQEFTLSFDYLSEAVIGRSTGDAAVTELVESFAQMGAPWTCGIDNLDDFAREAGMNVIDSVTLGDLHRTYWPRNSVESPIYAHYSLCTLRGLH